MFSKLHDQTEIVSFFMKDFVVINMDLVYAALVYRMHPIGGLGWIHPENTPSVFSPFQQFVVKPCLLVY